MPPKFTNYNMIWDRIVTLIGLGDSVRLGMIRPEARERCHREDDGRQISFNLTSFLFCAKMFMQACCNSYFAIKIS